MRHARLSKLGKAKPRVNHPAKFLAEALESRAYLSGYVTDYLDSFTGSNGKGPYGSVTFDSSGDAFGTTGSGGAAPSGGDGTVFEIPNGSTSITTVASFNGTDGEYPQAGLTIDTNGNLFGTTQEQTGSPGSVFEIASGTTSITTIASFAGGTNGSLPQTPVAVDSSGDLFGTTPDGGTGGDGIVYEIAHGTSAITTLANISDGSNEYEYAGVTLDSSGDLFGTTSYGGTSNDGAIFEIAHNTTSMTTLASFGGSYGENPFDGVTLDSDGDLFGTTYESSVYGSTDGTVFELPQGTTSITNLALFNGNNGGPSRTGVTLDSSGDIFGTTMMGGTGSYGVAYEIVPGTDLVTDLVTFSGTNGESPEAPPTLDSSGDLFVTTLDGGSAGDGTVFELTPNFTSTTTAVTSSAVSPTHGQPVTFTATVTPASGSGETGTIQFQVNGSNAGGPVALRNGAATYTTSSLAMGNNSVVAVYSGGPNFNGSPSPTFTQNVLAASAPTVLSVIPEDEYGNGVAAGSSASGQKSIVTQIAVAFSEPVNLTAGAFTLSLITNGGATHTDISGALGTPANPSGDGINWIIPIVASAGNTYAVGTASSLNDGSYQLGVTAADVTAVGGPSMASNFTSPTFQVLQLGYTLNSINFTGNNTYYPVGGVTFDSNGNLFGTTQNGGASHDGAVYEIAQGSTNITTFASFSGSNGQMPESSLTLDSTGDLFGTSEEGGASGYGDVFKIAYGSSTITPVASFNGTNGNTVSSGVVLDSSGDIFGTTPSSGTSNKGTVYEIANGSTTITTLVSFININGFLPASGLTIDSSGNLFGTTNQGGGASNDGVVYEVAHGSTAITVLASFSGGNGDAPLGRLAVDSADNLFGTTRSGGANGDGTIYEIGFGSMTITTLANFNDTNGEDAAGNLTLDANDDLFGTTEEGGADLYYGTVYELERGSTTITTLASFNGTNGEEPQAGLTLDSSGDLFGTTTYGGANSDGTTYELAFAAPAPPAWLSPTSAATWNSTTSKLTVTGPSTIIADPGSAEPNIVASGASADLKIQPSNSDVDIHIGGITLTNGAELDMVSVGAGRSHNNHNVLVVGTAGAANNPTVSVDASSKIDLEDNDMIVHTGTTDTTGQAELATIQALAATGRNVAPGGVFDGTWNGNGLTSSTAAAVDASLGYEQNILAVTLYSDMFLGGPSQGSSNTWIVGNATENLGPNDILVKYTYNGDLNLEGAVNGDAATIFSSFFVSNSGTPATDYAYGDLNGDGRINGNDATIFSSLFDNGLPGSGLPLL